MSQILHLTAEWDKHCIRAVETWGGSGIDDVSAGALLLLHHLLGLLQLSHIFVMSPPQIFHMSHHELDCTTRSSLLKVVYETFNFCYSFYCCYLLLKCFLIHSGPQHTCFHNASAYLMHGTKHLCCVGDSLHSPSKDVQRQLQRLQDLTALTVQTQALQCLKSHSVTSQAHLLSGGNMKIYLNHHTRTSRVSLPLVSSSWMFSSARLRACSSACSLCFRVYWSQRKDSANWEKAAWEQNICLYLFAVTEGLKMFHFPNIFCLVQSLSETNKDVYVSMNVAHKTHCM